MRPPLRTEHVIAALPASASRIYQRAVAETGRRFADESITVHFKLCGFCEYEALFEAPEVGEPLNGAGGGAARHKQVVPGPTAELRRRTRVERRAERRMVNCEGRAEYAGARNFASRSRAAGTCAPLPNTQAENDRLHTSQRQHQNANRHKYAPVRSHWTPGRAARVAASTVHRTDTSQVFGATASPKSSTITLSFSIT